MKLKTSVVASTLLSIVAFSAQAAQELTPEKAQSLQPFERITFFGRYDAIYEAAADASLKADARGAAAFYIQGTSEVNGGRWQVTVDLYKKDAPAATKETQYRQFSGVRELPKDDAVRLEPFDTVTVNGAFNNQPEVNEAIGNAARKKGAYAFYIVRQADINSSGSTQTITAFVYKKDAPKRQVQSPDMIPANSEAGKAAIAAGGAAASKVEIPGVATSSSLSDKVGNFFQTQSSNVGSRYTVTMSDGTKIQELNNATAAQMAPFDSISFRDSFSSPTDISEAVAKRAYKKGAKFYHITKQWQENGDHYTISADLYK
ncbi:DUF1471 domain-containing protein [Dickeya sp. CFBP 2040]|uniref:DUF1471 domain-containing protein n=1 Tax=Dickeya poaceiphila TaxID=568768 RepID=A0A5B8I849_9GAMM|nr:MULTISPECIES: DUF1471 family protein YdgH [Dickeya]NKI74012.1 DUF1471 domain-containing protein [Dickeya sp. CFBP 2040]QDX30048.1 DUF1471 domain-containing protein [Dickeya poaceiphila]